MQPKNERPDPAKQSRNKADEHAFDNLERLHPDAAGIDIGSETPYVCVPEDRDDPWVRTFGCFTPDLEAMAAWLRKWRIRTVVMGSTGVYWVSAYRVLEQHGFEVRLVEAPHARNVPGRKTDVWDCRWLPKLHTYGLLRGCFLPPQDMQVLRAYWRQRVSLVWRQRVSLVWRQRVSLVESCASQIPLMQKALEQRNLPWHKVLRDITGVTGLSIIRPIVAAERDAVPRARKRHPLLKSSEETLVKALTGPWCEEPLFILEQSLQTYDFHPAQILACDKRIKEYLSRFEDKAGPEGGSSSQPEPSLSSRRKNQPHFDLTRELRRISGVDLTKVEGISALTAQTLIAEIGVDVSRFPTEKQFASWTSLCPNNPITGGKVKSSPTRQSQNRVASALRLAAQSLHHSQSALGAYYRRMRAKLGAPKAITATAHKLARIIYRMLKYAEAYVAQGQQQYEKQCQEQSLKRLQKQARAMGFALVPNG